MKPAPILSSSNTKHEPPSVGEVMQDVDAVLERHRHELKACIERWLPSDGSTAAWRHARSTTEQQSGSGLTFSAHECGMLLATSLLLQDSTGSHSQSGRGAAVEALKREAVGGASIAEGVYYQSNGKENPSSASPNRFQEPDSETLPGEVCVLPGRLAEKDAHICSRDHGLDETDLKLEIGLETGLETTRNENDDTPRGFQSQKPTKNKPKKNRNSISTSSKTEFIEQQSFLQRVAGSSAYEGYSAMLIFANSVFLGWETEILAHRTLMYMDNPNAHFDVEQQEFVLFVGRLIFSVLFSIDLGLRWTAEGFVQFWASDDKWWNVMDLFVVTLGLIELAFDIANRASESDGDSFLSKFSVLKTMRFIRIVRVARIIRVMKAFRELRMMVVSILGSMKSLLWVALVFLLVFYVFGITFTTAATAAIEEAGETAKSSEDFQMLALNFGTLPRSVIALYMAMSGGNDWGQFYEALAELHWMYSCLFLVYITFSLFGVVNIVTGVFVEGAMQASQGDSEVLIYEEMESKKEYLNSVRKLLDEMDMDDNGEITLDELMESLQDQRVVSYFTALGLHVNDATEIFHILDLDNSGSITIEDFIHGCYKLQGAARHLDTKITQFGVNNLSRSLYALSNDIRMVKEKLEVT